MSVKVDIVCPCGKLYKTISVSGNPSNRTSGAGTCNACKKQFKWDISGTNSYSGYKR